MGREKPKGHRSKADLAIHMAISTMFAWANLVEALAQFMEGTDIPRDMIHEFLENLEDANAETLSDEMSLVFGQMVRSIRKVIASND